MIGAGSNRRDGWKTLDAKGGDYTARIPPLPPAVCDTKWDEVEWIHGITSLYPWDGEQALTEILQVMAPCGRLTLEQPDYRKALLRIEYVFGDPTLGDSWHMNRWAYTPTSLMGLLLRIGFKRVEILDARYHMPERDFRIEAYA